MRPQDDFDIWAYNNPDLGSWIVEFRRSFDETFSKAGHGMRARETPITNMDGLIKAAQFWRTNRYSARDVIAQFRKTRIGKHKPHLSEATNLATCERLLREMRDDMEMGAIVTGCTHILREAEGDPEKLRALQGLAAAGELMESFDYARSQIRGRVGHLSPCEAQLQVLRSPLGSINALVRCMMSNYDPIVIERFGQEAHDYICDRTHLRSYLLDQGQDVVNYLNYYLKPK